MSQLDHLAIVKLTYENERKRVIATASELALALEGVAKMIRKAVETEDLRRIAWLTRAHDETLATRAEVLADNLHLIAGFAAHETAT